MRNTSRKSVSVQPSGVALRLLHVGAWPRCRFPAPPRAQVLFTPDLWVPLVNLKDVYILPGIPRLFTAMVGAHKAPFRGPACSSAALYTNTVEGDLAGGGPMP